MHEVKHAQQSALEMLSKKTQRTYESLQYMVVIMNLELTVPDCGRNRR